MWLTFALLAACASPDGERAVVGEAAFDPVAFFTGPTSGDGVLTRRDGGIDRRFTVTSTGGIEGDGAFVLSQRIAFADGEIQRRTFRLYQDRKGEWRGTLDGAVGEVGLTTHGSVTRLTYALDGVPLGRIEQFLYAQPGGNTLINEGWVRVGGVTVRRMHEIIRKPTRPESP